MGKYNYNISSVEKAFKIIEIMSENNGGMSVTQISEPDCQKSSTIAGLFW